MKKFEEYRVLGKDRRFEDAPTDVAEKIKSLCGVASKFRENIPGDETTYLWKKVREIMEVDDNGCCIKTLRKLENVLPHVYFQQEVLLKLPNGFIVEADGGFTFCFYTPDEAAMQMEYITEKEDAYFAMCEEAATAEREQDDEF
jgi:hypothetical protein